MEGLRTFSEYEYGGLIPYLRGLTPGTHYVEIGSWCGASLQFAARNIPIDSIAVGVDPLDTYHVTAFMRHYGMVEHPARSLYDVIRGLNVAIVPQASIDFQMSPMFDLLRGKAGFLLIDGLHEYDAVLADAPCIALVIPGGIVAFHDYNEGNPGFAEYCRGVDEVIEFAGLHKEAQFESLLICRKGE